MGMRPEQRKVHSLGYRFMGPRGGDDEGWNSRYAREQRSMKEFEDMIFWDSLGVGNWHPAGFAPIWRGFEASANRQRAANKRHSR
jgi:hypothetical protein